MKLLKLKCDSCCAELDIDVDKLQAYCPYCGAKLLLDLERIEEVLKEREK